MSEQPREHSVPCERCPLIVGGVYAPTMTTNPDAVCDRHETEEARRG